MDFLKLTEDILSVDSVLKLVSSEKCGAVSMFIGTTRDNFEGKEVKRLEYEAYESMALKVMKNICGDIRKKWEQIENIAIYHRLGTVPVLEASVVIAISSPHRVDSIAAVQYCIEHLKAIEDSVSSTKQNDLNESLDPHTVQIIASHSEMQSRIQKFIDRKKEQNNLNNIREFIGHRIVNTELSEVVDEISTCARVDAILLKSKDSKSHLKVMRTQNEWGPQTKIEKINDPKLLMEKDANLSTTGFSSGIEERFSNVEQHLNISKPISADIYSRLKKIEDRILEIESISPEYAKFWSRKRSNGIGDSETGDTLPKKMKFTSDDIKKKMKSMM